MKRVISLEEHRCRKDSEQAQARDEVVRAAVALALKFSEYRRLGHKTMSVGAKEATALIEAAERLAAR